MHLLIVEDQLDKKENIEHFLIANFSEVVISDSNSLRDALKKIVLENNYDLILLDMSMPAFAPSESHYDDSPESYAGRELMEQMRLRGISIPVIIVTQYSSFEGGSVTLEGLSKNFYKKYDNFYCGYVYYNSANEDWKKELKMKISDIKGI